MGCVMVKLIAIDLDGTLLNSRKKISEANIHAIQEAQGRGLKVIICTGRIFAGAMTFARELGLSNGPMIGCNGALIKELETGEMLYSQALDMEDCLEVVRSCHEEDLYFHLYVKDTLFSEKLQMAALSYLERNRDLPEDLRMDIRIVEDVEKILVESGTAPTKFVVISEDTQKLAKVRQKVGRLDNVNIVSSDADNFEVIHRDVSKGRALKYIAELLGISMRETMAIGDNENDISMFEAAGLSVAMGNAIDTIKGMAHHVTDSNDEDGVAKAIRRYALGIDV